MAGNAKGSSPLTARVLKGSSAGAETAGTGLAGTSSGVEQPELSRATEVNLTPCRVVRVVTQQALRAATVAGRGRAHRAPCLNRYACATPCSRARQTGKPYFAQGMGAGKPGWEGCRCCVKGVVGRSCEGSGGGGERECSGLHMVVHVQWHGYGGVCASHRSSRPVLGTGSAY